MPPIHRVLMPTDGSPCSEAAIREGLETVKKLGAEVVFLHVLEDPLLPLYPSPYTYDMSYRPQLYQDLQNAAREALSQAESLADQAGVPCTTRLVEHQHPVEAIHHAEAGVDLVVMGTHGRRGFNRLMLGSVAEEALHRAEKPYLMFRHAPGERVKAEQPIPRPSL